MGKVTVLDHPLIKHKLTYIRDKIQVQRNLRNWFQRFPC